MKISIDMGGTNIRVSQVVDGVCVQKLSEPCQAQADAETVVNQLLTLIGRLMTDEVSGIGIGVPSVVDTDAGIVYNVANIPSWKEVQLKERIEARFGLPVAINNDSNCFALGESLFGAGRQAANMVGVTIGTGIGAGVVVGGKLYSGVCTGAGEVGSLPYLDADFEHYCSSFFFKRYQTTGMEAAQKAREGDAEALRLWDEFGQHFGQFIKALLFAYAPQLIVLGGGISTAFPLFEPSMRCALADFPYPMMLDKVSIVPATLPDAALLGASALFTHMV